MHGVPSGELAPAAQRELPGGSCIASSVRAFQKGRLPISQPSRVNVPTPAQISKRFVFSSQEIQETERRMRRLAKLCAQYARRNRAGTIKRRQIHAVRDGQPCSRLPDLRLP